MREIDRNFFGFKRKDIWFSERPFDVTGYDSVIFNACESKGDYPGFRRSEFTTLIIDLTQDTDTLWKNIDRSSCRKKINKARNNGIEIGINEHYEDFFNINSSFRRNKGLTKWAIDVEFMKKYCTLFVTKLAGQVIGGELFIDDGNHIRGWITASRRFDVHGHDANIIGYANRLMIWESILYAKARGIKVYDMGGYYTGSKKNEALERINSFKASFGGKLVTNYTYEKNYSVPYDMAKRIYQFSIEKIHIAL